jgi:hypothetical protein
MEMSTPGEKKEEEGRASPVLSLLLTFCSGRKSIVTASIFQGGYI